MGGVPVQKHMPVWSGGELASGMAAHSEWARYHLTRDLQGYRSSLGYSATAARFNWFSSV